MEGKGQWRRLRCDGQKESEGMGYLGSATGFAWSGDGNCLATAIAEVDGCRWSNAVNVWKHLCTVDSIHPEESYQNVGSNK